MPSIKRSYYNRKKCFIKKAMELSKKFQTDILIQMVDHKN